MVQRERGIGGSRATVRYTRPSGRGPIETGSETGEGSGTDGIGMEPETASLHAEAPETRLNAWLATAPRFTLAAAESCTGGEVAHRITAVAGSSAYFLGSIVAYANDAKATLLGVPREVLERPGAVSEPCARAMAEGARRVFGADLAVSTTGIAGPGGGTARKPVGLVYIAVAGPSSTVCEEHHFPGDRASVVAAAADAALVLLATRVQAALAEDEHALDPASPGPHHAESERGLATPSDLLMS